MVILTYEFMHISYLESHLAPLLFTPGALISSYAKKKKTGHHYVFHGSLQQLQNHAWNLIDCSDFSLW